MNSLHKLNKSDGFSLVEMLVATAISTITMLIAVFVLAFGIQNYKSLFDKFTNLEAANWAELVIRNNLSMALNLTQVDNATDMNAFNNNIGKIRLYNLDDEFDPSEATPKFDTIAFFLKENIPSRHNAAMLTSIGNRRFTVTGIFLLKPTAKTYGVLYIANRTMDQIAAGFAPEPSDLKIPNVVGFKVEEIISSEFSAYDATMDTDLQGQRMVSKVMIELTLRSFMPQSGTEVVSWCPPFYMTNSPTECPTNIGTVDTTRAFDLTVRNNVLGQTVTQKEQNLNRTPLYRRPIENVYFLKPSIPIGDLVR